jgi:hypothetical protein
MKRPVGIKFKDTIHVVTKDGNRITVYETTTDNPYNVKNILTKAAHLRGVQHDVKDLEGDDVIVGVALYDEITDGYRNPREVKMYFKEFKAMCEKYSIKHKR